jgi:hypothetical protein
LALKAKRGFDSSRERHLFNHLRDGSIPYGIRTENVDAHGAHSLEALIAARSPLTSDGKPASCRVSFAQFKPPAKIRHGPSENAHEEN